MPHRRAVDEIQGLDPERDHQRIMHLVASYEFPWDITRSLEFALFRTFASPGISALLDRTGEFGARPQKRYDDTDLIVSTFFERGYDSPDGREALRKMNRLHGRFDISNEDFLYVLSTFVFEPIRWMARFGYRPMTRTEQLASFHFWRQVGRRMAIREIPDTCEELESFNREYERTRFRFSDTNRRVGAATRDLFLGWLLPRPLFALGKPMVYALMDDALLDAFGFPRPPAVLRAAVEAAMRARARVIRLLPERRRARLRTEMRHRSYPSGWSYDRLGPPGVAMDGPDPALAGAAAGVSSVPSAESDTGGM
jgi:hypothetical protein